MRGLLLAAWLASAVSAQTVQVGVFVLFRPTELVVEPVRGGVLVVDRGAERSTLEGSHRMRIRAPGVTVTGRNGGAVDLVLSVPGKIRRQYRGTLRVAGEGDHLVAIVAMDRETAVASIVAAESPPIAALEALKAQAVVARSFLIAAKGRHSGFDFCDTTHCQFLRQPPAEGKAADQATRQTRGLVLAYQGHVFAALYSAGCGGRTRSLADAGWKVEDYPYFAVDCEYCRRHPLDPATGHAIGLCQRGAAAMAGEGSGYRSILEHYYPGTAVVDEPSR